MKLGQCVMTRKIADLVADNKLFSQEVMFSMNRYTSGDWGDLSDNDKMANKEALETGDRIFAAYKTMHGKIYIITECDRSVTTVLFSDEY